ncbi:MAG TPA: hypothetical protein VFH85_02170 [Gammaproteobacteria bacterium]|nr:hypothetical protein [Gammaproteobacteria bacterium]
MPTQVERLTAVETEIKAMRAELRELRDDVRTLLARDNKRAGAATAVKALYGVGVATLSIAVSLLVAWWHH